MCDSRICSFTLNKKFTYFKGKIMRKKNYFQSNKAAAVGSLSYFPKRQTYPL